MKKMLFLAAAILLSVSGFAQRNTVERLFRDAAAAKGTQVVDMNEMGGSFNISTPGIQLDGLEVITFESSPSDVKAQMSEAIRNLDDPAYETWVSVSSDGENVRVLAKKGGEKINEVIVLVTGNEMVLVKLRGDMTKESILQAVNSNR